MQVRSPWFPLDDSIPRHWFFGHPVPTHLANALSLLFPAGERFFVRSVRKYMKEIEADPKQLADVRTFFGQEGRHASAHDEYIDMLEAQGYRVREFLKVYEAICFGLVERVSSPELRLAATAACEHFTALLAEEALREDDLAAAHPVIRDLLLWHACEEVEHRSVAFDVLQKVAPSYPLRLAGLALGGGLLGAFWVAGTITLLAQDGDFPKTPTPELREFRKRKGSPFRVFSRGIRSYVRRDFHPNQLGGDRLAAEFLATFAQRPRPSARATRAKAGGEALAES